MASCPLCSSLLKPIRGLRLTRLGARVGRRAIVLPPIQRAVLERLLFERKMPTPANFDGYSAKGIEVAVSHLRGALAPEYIITKAYDGLYQLKKGK